jgi:hypothetical protein
MSEAGQLLLAIRLERGRRRRKPRVGPDGVSGQKVRRTTDLHLLCGRLFNRNARLAEASHIPRRPMPPAAVECPAGALPFGMLYCLPKLGE